MTLTHIPAAVASPITVSHMASTKLSESMLLSLLCISLLHRRSLEIGVLRQDEEIGRRIGVPDVDGAPRPPMGDAACGLRRIHRELCVRIRFAAVVTRTEPKHCDDTDGDKRQRFPIGEHDHPPLSRRRFGPSQTAESRADWDFAF